MNIHKKIKKMIDNKKTDLYIKERRSEGKIMSYKDIITNEPVN